MKIVDIICGTFFISCDYQIILALNIFFDRDYGGLTPA
jgi:hypothetical protein